MPRWTWLLAAAAMLAWPFAIGWTVWRWVRDGYDQIAWGR